MVTNERINELRKECAGLDIGRLNQSAEIFLGYLDMPDLAGETLLELLVSFWVVQLKKYEYLAKTAKDYHEKRFLSLINYEYAVLLSTADGIAEFAVDYCLKQAKHFLSSKDEVSHQRWLAVAGKIEKLPSVSNLLSC
ncbi:hypothetical protein HYS10_00870 [Candidatus Collierbacteria bacterium]|nr:hypothetical protein [Candidatus Collierbacteria bacterium]